MGKAENEDTTLFRGVVVGLVVSGILFLFLLGLYLWRFGSQGLSPQQDHWGQFGDFLGGTLNPLLGFASVVLLALTLRAQHRVLAETRRQSVLEELQRLVSNVSRELDAILSTRIDEGDGNLFAFWEAHRPKFTSLATAPLSAPNLRDVLECAVERLQHSKLNYFDIDAIAETWHVGAVHSALVRLDACLEAFLVRGGDTVVARLYGAQYRGPALFQYALQALAHYPPGVREYPVSCLQRLGLGARIDSLRDGLSVVNVSIDQALAQQREANQAAARDLAGGA